MQIENKYEFLSAERKRLQQQGLLPEFYQTGGWGLFKSKYMEEAPRLRTV